MQKNQMDAVQKPARGRGGKRPGAGRKRKRPPPLAGDMTDLFERDFKARLTTAGRFLALAAAALTGPAPGQTDPAAAAADGEPGGRVDDSP